MASETITWTTHEFEAKDRHRDWNWYAGLIAVVAAIVAFFYGNIFFGIFAIIAGAVVILFAFQKPSELTITLDEKGISINENIVEYASIKQFWLDETQKPDKLLLLIKGSFVPVITLPLEGVTTEEVRAYLAPRATEELLRQSNSIALFDRLGF